MAVTGIIEQLERDEGVAPEVYLDSRGNLTIGIGHLLRGGHPLSPVAIQQILSDDVLVVTQELLHAHPWMTTLSPARFGAMVNMAFNLGVGGLNHFHKTLAALRVKDWDTAAKEMLDSTWARQVGDRAVRLAEQIRKDVWI